MSNRQMESFLEKSILTTFRAVGSTASRRRCSLWQMIKSRRRIQALWLGETDVSDTAFSRTGTQLHSDRAGPTLSMMDENLVLSRIRLADYLACQRRFQLRYLERLPWPAAQLKPDAERSRLLGQQFHTALHRYFLGLPVSRDAAADPALQKWLGLFLNYEPQLPAGKRYPEVTLTVPIGSKMLTGRFDLLVISEEDAHIFDWKTQEKARPSSELEDDFQTRIYLALAVEGSQALGRKVNPEQLSLTYWYASDPPTAVSIMYGEKEHADNLAFLGEIIQEISNRLNVDGQWPLTDDLRQCGRCAYQIFCGRKPGDIDLSSWEEQEDLVDLEPDHP